MVECKENTIDQTLQFLQKARPAMCIRHLGVVQQLLEQKFVARLVPSSNLTSSFHFEVTCNVLLALGECEATVIAVIYDNNKVNQAFKKLYKPFIVRSLSNQSLQMFLMFDPVHIIKNLRKYWITERTRTLCFPVIDSFANNVVQSCFACWNHLQDLYQAGNEQNYHD